MTTPRFPRTPDIHDRPFQNGKNPFTDLEKQDNSDSSQAGTIYSSSSAGAAPDQPIPYEAFLANRSGWVFAMGAIGFSLACLSLIVSVVAWIGAGWGDGLVYSLPISLVAVILTIPAWYLGHMDLRAIRAGAMNPQGRRRTRSAFWLGLLGTILILLPLVGGLASQVLYVRRWFS